MSSTFGWNGLLIRLQPTRLVIKVPQVVVHEADEPDVLVDLGDAHLLSGEDSAQVHLALLVADPAARGHDRGSIVEGILELAQTPVRPR